MELKENIKSFIEENLIVFDEKIDISDSDNIFEKGYVNSLFAMKLLNYIENDIGILVDHSDMDINNFSSINSILYFIQKKQENSLQIK